MKKTKNNDNPDMDLTTVTAEEFEFILNDMRLKQKSIVQNSDFARGTLYNDLKESRENKTAFRTYWIAMLINLIGEIPFQCSRKKFFY